MQRLRRKLKILYFRRGFFFLKIDENVEIRIKYNDCINIKKKIQKNQNLLYQVLIHLIYFI